MMIALVPEKSRTEKRQIPDQASFQILSEDELDIGKNYKWLSTSENGICLAKDRLINVCTSVYLQFEYEQGVMVEQSRTRQLDIR